VPGGAPRSLSRHDDLDEAGAARTVRRVIPTRLLVAVLCAGSILACSAVGRRAGPAATSHGSAEVTALPCQSAPAWLASALERSLTPRGATISRAFIAHAVELDGTDGVNRAWLVAAVINGAGVRPELGLWRTDVLDPGSIPSLRSVNAAAQRYSSLPAGDRGRPPDSGAVAVLATCVGPLLEP